MPGKLSCIILTILLSLSCGRSSSGLVTDQDLQAHFDANYWEFEELKNLCLAIQSGDAALLGQDRASLNYRISELKIKLGCKKVAIMKDAILLIYQERNGYASYCDKGYLYSIERRKDARPNGVDLEEVFQAEQVHSGILVKELKGNWDMQLAYDY